MSDLQDNEYRNLVQMLNEEQKEFFYHVLHFIKLLMNHATAFSVDICSFTNR